MNHIILFLYFASFSAFLILLNILFQTQHKYKQKVLILYVIHMTALNVTGLGDMVLNYIIINLASTKSDIELKYRTIFMLVSILVLIGIVISTVAYFLIASQLWKKSPTVKLGSFIKLLIMIGTISLLWGLWDLFVIREINRFMIGLKLLDYLGKAIILVFSFILFIKSLKLPFLGKRTIIKRFSLFYLFVHVFFFYLTCFAHIYPHFFIFLAFLFYNPEFVPHFLS